MMGRVTHLAERLYSAQTLDDAAIDQWEPRRFARPPTLARPYVHLVKFYEIWEEATEAVVAVADHASQLPVQ